MHRTAIQSMLRRFSAARPKPAVMQDASELIRRLAPGAYAAAQLKSFQEDIGLLAAPGPGYWRRVACEIARRSGRPEAERTATFAA